MEYDIRCIRGEHYEVYRNGIFLFSADSKPEALREIEELEE
jgi:hypothetical protein